MSHTAVIAGVGPGLGDAIAHRFVDEGCRVGLFARSSEFIEDLAADLGPDVVAVPTDITDPDAVEAGFDAVRDAYGPIDVLVNNASGATWDGLLEVDPADFEHATSVSATGGLLCAQEAVSDMLNGDGGTVIFSGATTSLRGREGAVGFSAAKFAARGLAESMARELGPEGVHVAHVVIDGQILGPDDPDEFEDRGEETFLDPAAIADSYWHLVSQDRSAWTLELDLRPHVEEF
jgi:NAD(P)-dependent dehydrogenase (short-subunit alcohol dehydrogenase family)